MRSSFLISLLMAVSVAGVYWYQSSAAVCPAPLAYRIGTIDESFSITKEEAIRDTKAATQLWESRADRELFIYSETADFTVDFVFDERQATADSEVSKKIALDAEREKSEEAAGVVELLQVEYKALVKTYENQTAEYEAELTEYNQEVNKYNDRGGAPAGVFGQLEEQKESLETEASKLSEIADDLNRLVSETNKLSQRANNLVESYNREVNRYNDEFGFSREFTQGDQQGNKIHIYKFSSDEELITVLAHEFGHALGIGHVENEESLMYYLLEDTDEIIPLSAYDLEAYQGVCGLSETKEQKVRRIIREALAKF